MYIAEVAPAAMRGRLVSINQLTIVIGILLAQFVNWWIVRGLPAGASDEFMAQSWYVPTGWRWMFGLTAVPSLLFFVGMFFVPESPRWLAKNGKREQARGVLAKIGGERLRRGGAGRDRGHAGRRDRRRCDFRELLDPRMAQGAGAGRGAGRVPAVVRHQRHLQLRRGDLPRRPATTFPTC